MRNDSATYRYHQVGPRLYEVFERATNRSIGYVRRNGPDGRWAWFIRDENASNGYEFDMRAEASAALADVARAEAE